MAMTPETATDFEMQGRFFGFFRDIFGKRRMVLQVAGEEVYLKVPKPLRAALAETLVAGQEVSVVGRHVADDRMRPRAVVSQVRVAGQSACVSCPIQVCAKKNCWRNGGRELWNELERRIESAGLAGLVKLKAVGCLDRCKHGPNAEAADVAYERCSPASAVEILAPYLEHAV